MKIWAYGDSFVAGDQDIPGRVDAIEENTEYNRYNVSFAAHLSKKLNVELINRGISGCSNFVQLDKLLLDINEISQDDIVLFGITTPWRDRFVLPNVCPVLFKDTRGPSILNRELVYGQYDISKVAVLDLFYILSTIQKLEEIYNIRIVKFNLFHDVILEASEIDQRLFVFNDFIGLGVPGNTLLDLLTDNWGNPIKRISDHSKWQPPNEFTNLFTRCSHPNIEGHKKIASWIEFQLKTMGIL